MSEPISISKSIANKTFSSNAHPPIHEFHSNVNFTDLDVFTQGQPFDHFKKMREVAPVFLHPPFLNDPEPGFWSLTRYEDILKVSSTMALNISIISVFTGSFVCSASNSFLSCST